MTKRFVIGLGVSLVAASFAFAFYFSSYKNQGAYNMQSPMVTSSVPIATSGSTFIPTTSTPNLPVPMTTSSVADIIPSGAEPDYRDIAKRAVAICGRDTQLLLVRATPSAENVVSFYEFRGDCGGLVFRSGDTNPRQRFGMISPRQPIPLQSWKIGAKEALQRAIPILRDLAGPDVKIATEPELRNDGDFLIWSVGGVYGHDAWGVRLNATTGEIIDHRKVFYPAYN